MAGFQALCRFGESAEGRAVLGAKVTFSYTFDLSCGPAARDPGAGGETSSIRYDAWLGGGADGYAGPASRPALRCP